MRRIFVPLHGPDDASTLLQLAATLALPFDARIEAAFVEDEPDRHDGASSSEGLATRSLFESWSAAQPEADLPLRATWREISDGAVYAGASIGRASDLIITRSLGPSTVQAPEEDRIVHAARSERRFRDALLASGRLTLLAPPGQIEAAGLLDQVVVAWDGSAGAAHALGQSLSLLAQARSVRVIIIGRNTVGLRACDAIESYVGLYNDNTRLAVQDNTHRQTGRVLLDAMHAEGASAVVMGTRGRSQSGAAGITLGGTILKVIEKGRIPILTAS